MYHSINKGTVVRTINSTKGPQCVPFNKQKDHPAYHQLNKGAVVRIIYYYYYYCRGLDLIDMRYVFLPYQLTGESKRRKKDSPFLPCSVILPYSYSVLFYKNFDIRSHNNSVAPKSTAPPTLGGAGVLTPEISDAFWYRSARYDR